VTSDFFSRCPISRPRPRPRPRSSKQQAAASSSKQQQAAGARFDHTAPPQTASTGMASARRDAKTSWAMTKALHLSNSRPLLAASVAWSWAAISNGVFHEASLQIVALPCQTPQACHGLSRKPPTGPFRDPETQGRFNTIHHPHRSIAASQHRSIWCTSSEHGTNRDQDQDQDTHRGRGSQACDAFVVDPLCCYCHCYCTCTSACTQ
jgi:hypothetical protein